MDVTENIPLQVETREPLDINDLDKWSVRPQQFIVDWFSAISSKFINNDNTRVFEKKCLQNLHILVYLCEKTKRVKKCEANPQIKTQAISAIQKVQSELLDETSICFSQKRYSSQMRRDLRRFYCSVGAV